MDLGLAGKRALLTGASRGLGYATARLLAMEGCQVAINSRSEASITEAAEKLAAQTGQKAIGLAGDVTDAKTCAALVDRAAAGMGGLDLLVTNAGGPPAGKFDDFSEDTWRQAVDLSFLNHVWLIRAALPHLRKSEAASVLTITSYSVKQPIQNLILSNSVRAATIGLTKSLALELGHEGIRFNSILPAWTETERVTNLMSHRAQVNNTSIDEEIAKQSADSSLGRMGQPEEFANAAVFLLSPAASYLTGVMLSVDGGMYKGVY